MKIPLSRTPPSGAPEGTLWSGGPVDRYQITLRVTGDDLDPEQVSALLGCAPTRSERAGIPVYAPNGNMRTPERGRWSLRIDSMDIDENDDVEDGIKMLLARLSSSPDVWTSLTTQFKVDIFCGLFLTTTNREFSLSSDVSTLLSRRGIAIGFDSYFDPPGTSVQ